MVVVSFSDWYVSNSMQSIAISVQKSPFSGATSGEGGYNLSVQAAQVLSRSTIWVNSITLWLTGRSSSTSSKIRAAVRLTSASLLSRVVS